MKRPQKRGLHSFSLSWRNVSHLMQGKMGLVRVTSLKTQSLATGFGTVFLRSSQEGQPQKLLLTLKRERAFFSALHQIFRPKFLFPVTCDAKAAGALCYVVPNIIRPGDLITVYSNWHVVLSHKY